MSNNSLDAHRLPGIGPMRQARLQEAGVQTLEQLASADPQQLAALPGFHLKVVLRAQEAVRALLQSTGPSGPAGDLPEIPDLPDADAPEEAAVSEAEVEAEADDEPEPPSHKDKKRGGRKKRGLDAARRIEKTLEWVHRAREHAKSGKRKPRKRTRKQLGKLATTLEKVQKQVIRDGISTDAVSHLEDLLSPLERRLKRFSKRRASKRRLRKASSRARRARRAIRKSLD